MASVKTYVTKREGETTCVSIVIHEASVIEWPDDGTLVPGAGLTPEQAREVAQNLIVAAYLAEEGEDEECS